MVIRDERPGDAIHDLTVLAFAPMPFSDGSEAPMISALREAGDLTLSLVADDRGTIVGHIAFSPVTIDGVRDHWFGLGPVSVRPDFQRRGIGKTLIQTGLERLRKAGARGCALVGNPAIYGRVGFMNEGGLSYRNLDRKLVHWLAFEGPPPRGELAFAPAFDMERH